MTSPVQLHAGKPLVPVLGPLETVVRRRRRENPAAPQCVVEDQQAGRRQQVTVEHEVEVVAVVGLVGVDEDKVELPLQFQQRIQRITLKECDLVLKLAFSK